MVEEVPINKLRRTYDPASLHCETTEELESLKDIIGQERALRALKFGLEIEQLGFNIYVAGYPGTGRTTTVKGFLENIAKTKPEPSDWCYINNFNDEYEPKAIGFPPGKVKEFQTDISELINDVQIILPKTFESEDYGIGRAHV